MTTAYQSSDYLNPQVDKFLQSVTKYVSKPLGFDKIYSEDQIKKRGINQNRDLYLFSKRFTKKKVCSL